MTSSKSNIKHETLDTKIPDTIYKTVEHKHIEFARASKEELEAKFLVADAPASQASGERPSRSVVQRESGNVIAPALRISDITYACLTLHAVVGQSRRRQVNLDFKTYTSGKEFNKLKFTLSWKPSEFLKNIPDSEHGHRSYAQAMGVYEDLKAETNKVWIGKGNPRKYIKGVTRTFIKPYTSMVLAEQNGSLFGQLWLEDADFTFEFDNFITTDSRYTMKCEPIKNIETVWGSTGGWL